MSSSDIAISPLDAETLIINSGVATDSLDNIIDEIKKKYNLPYQGLKIELCLTDLQKTIYGHVPPLQG